MEVAPLDQLVSDVRAAAEACGALIVEAALSLEPGTTPVARVEGRAFPALVQAVRPRIVYVLSSPFAAAEDLLVTLEEDDQRLLTRPRFKQLINKWRHRDGQSARVALGLMCEGVLHGIIEDADWLGEFEAAAEALVEDVGLAQDDHDRRAEAAEDKRLAPYVEQLLADPRFAGPKVGAAKRTALAQSLFAGVDRQIIRAIVERAERNHWLANAGR